MTTNTSNVIATVSKTVTALITKATIITTYRCQEIVTTSMIAKVQCKARA